MSRPELDTMRLEDADAEQKAWEDLCAWVQQHAKFIRISQVALMAGMSVEMAQALLLRDRDKTRIPRTSQRLEALLDVFTRPPFGYVSHVHEEK